MLNGSARVGGLAFMRRVLVVVVVVVVVEVEEMPDDKGEGRMGCIGGCCALSS